MSFAALALGAAFGVMSGRGAFAGMIAAGVIPIVTGLFGGTRLSVSGPTGPMTAVSSVVIALAYDKFGGERLLAEQFITLVFMLTAAGLLLAGLLRTGRLIRFVPKTVILGFMSGIAMVIWVDQIKVLFGLDGKEAPTGTMHLNLAYSAITFLLILTLPKLLAKLNLPKRVAMFIPATLTSIIIMTVITTVFSIDIQHISLGAPVSSLGEFKQMMLSYLPTSRIMTQEHLLMAAPYALQLIMLGYLDSLLTALIMDHLTSKKSRLDKELVGQGLANGLSALLGGIPGAQATIRSVLLFKEGAHTRIGAMSAGVFTLLGLVAFRNSIGLITSAVFIGVLFKAALDVFEKEFLTLYVKRRWYTSRKRNIQIAFIMYTMLLTAFYDLNVAVISATILHYVCKRFWRIADVEDKLEKAVEEELAKHVRA
ncbi:MAG: SulP family inorganic anion transporter [Flavobacteriales bacterium]|nr:SulP family inorganic anion transporter [Flavobacteriales bacterium]